MLIDITEASGRPLEVFQTLPSEMLEFDIPSSTPTLFHGDSIRMLFQEFRGNGFSAWYNRFWAHRQTVLRASGDIAVLELRIGLTNQLRGDWERVPQPSLKPGEFNLSFTPHIDTRANFNTGGYCATFDIHIERSLLEQLAIEDKDLRKFLKKVDRRLPAALAPSPHQCPAAMLDSVQLILQNPYRAAAQGKLLEWNARQILLIALETSASPEHPLPFTLTPKDIEGLHAIKNYINNSFPKWPSHDTLCRKGEINEFKLKAGFKHLFKMTAYDYHMLLKFQEAKKLLLENKETIKAIAYQIGYDHHTSFTQEFKRQFGYTPSWFQKHGRL